MENSSCFKPLAKIAKEFVSGRNAHSVQDSSLSSEDKKQARKGFAQSFWNHKTQRIELSGESTLQRLDQRVIKSFPCDNFSSQMTQYPLGGALPKTSLGEAEHSLESNATESLPNWQVGSTVESAPSGHRHVDPAQNTVTDAREKQPARNVSDGQAKFLDGYFAALEETAIQECPDPKQRALYWDSVSMDNRSKANENIAKAEQIRAVVAQKRNKTMQFYVDASKTMEFYVDASTFNSAETNIALVFETPVGGVMMPFLLQITPVMVHDTNFGGTFRAAQGCGKIQLICKGEPPPNSPLAFQLSIGHGHHDEHAIRGPMVHDFNLISIAGLPEELETWNFLSAEDGGQIRICLSVHGAA